MEVTHSHEPPYGFWETNLCPLPEQQMLFIDESSIYPFMEVFLSPSSMRSISIPLGIDFHEYVVAFINTVNNTVLYNRNSLRPLHI